MTGALRRARANAYIRALESVSVQADKLGPRILRAEVAGDYAEADRLRSIADSCKESAGQYRAELHNLTAQGALNLEVSR